MTDRARELLYRSFDAELAGPEKTELEAALAASADLRAEADDIGRLRRAVARSAAQGFSAGFAGRVRARIAADSPIDVGLDALFASIRGAFRYVAAAAVPVCVALLIWNLRLPAAQGSAQNDTATDALFETPLETLLENGP